MREARDIARKQGFAQAVEIIAGDVEHGFLDLLQREFAGRVEQGELLYLLVRSEQVAFDAFGDEVQRVIAGLLLLPAQAPGDPRREFGEVGRDQLDGDTGLG